MLGNVWEWCLDYEGDYADAPLADPVGQTGDNCETRVLRGGSYAYNCDFCRCATRFLYQGQSSLRGSSERFADVGFRVVVVPPATTP